MNFFGWIRPSVLLIGIFCSAWSQAGQSPPGLYGTVRRAKEIAELNRLKNPDLILVGQVLQLPQAATHSEAEQKQTLETIRASRTDSKTDQKIDQRDNPKTEQKLTLSQGRAKEELARYITEEEARAPENVKSARANLFSGEEKLRKQDFVSAARLFTDSRSKNPEEFSAWFQEIRAHQENGDRAQAKRVKDDLLTLYPQFSEVPFLKGVQ